MSETYIIIKENYIMNNLKSNDLLNIYFKQEYKILYLNYEKVIEFILSNNNNNINIIFYTYNIIDSYEINIMNYVKNNIMLCKIYFILIDWWRIPPPGNYDLQHYFVSNIFYAINYKVITFIYDIYQLNSYYNKDFNFFKNNIIHINLWSCYNLAFTDFNNNPINKVLISGRTSEICYPERAKLLLQNNNNIEYYEYNMNDIDSINNNYNKVLNNYIAAFTSSVYIFNETLQQYTNTNMVLLKTFEILASGSLLLVPITEDLYLQKFGIINKENCLLLDFNKDLNEQINNILNINNLSYINNIRYNGYLHAKNNLNSYNKFMEFKNIIGI
jgi:hypothetical protein